jgi:hypothetical protein
VGCGEGKLVLAKLNSDPSGQLKSFTYSVSSGRDIFAVFLVQFERLSQVAYDKDEERTSVLDWD